MPIPTADPKAPKRATSRPRKWGNRRPASKRLDLSPEEAEARDEKRRAKHARKFLSVRVTDAEKATIQSRATAYGMKLSDFARTILLSGLKEPPPPRIDPAVVNALAFALSKAGFEGSKHGANLNQIAKRANEAAKLGREKEARALLAMEAEARRVLAQIAGNAASIAEALARVIEL